MIVLDTSVLSHAFRRKVTGAPDVIAGAVREILEDDYPFAVPAVVVQELLSGVRDPTQFRRLRSTLETFPIVFADLSIHVRAAEVVNVCRSRGVTVSAVDALIAATAIASDAELFTSDADFGGIAKHAGLRLFRMPGRSA